jgi:hypothetical protein
MPYTPSGSAAYVLSHFSPLTSYLQPERKLTNDY